MPTQLSALGLVTSVNEAEAPEGSLIRAENCVIRNKNIIEPRRGFKAYDYAFGSSASRTKQGFFYQDKAHVHYGTTLAYDTGSAFVDYSGTFTGNDETLMRMKYQTFRDNLYLATTTGIRKISDVGNTPRNAGVPQSLCAVNRATGNLGLAAANSSSVSRTSNVTTVIYNALPPSPSTYSTPVNFLVGETVFCTSTDANFSGGSKVITTDVVNGSFPSQRNFTYNDVAANVGSIGAGFSVRYETQILLNSSGFLADGYQCAYRFVLDIPDNNHQILLGPPSDRLVVQNVTGTVGYVATESKNVQLKIRLPENLPSGTRLWIYRTEQTTVTPNVPPSEEMYKAYEHALTSQDLTNRVVLIKDIVPDVWLEDVLYTSPVAEGILNANFQPPKAKDLASWNNRLWFSNVESKHEKTFRIIGPIPDGTSFVIGVGSAKEIITGRTSFNAFLNPEGRNVNDFVIPTSGTPSQILNQTSKNIVECINRFSSFVTAYYDDNADESFATIRLQSINGYQQFALSCVNALNSTVNARSLIDPILPPNDVASTFFNYTGINLSRVNNVVTATFTGEQVFLSGDLFSVSSAGDASFNGTNFVVLTCGPTFFTYAQTAANASTTGALKFTGPFTSGLSTNEVVVNRVYFSKLQQGEAVPLLNYMDVGSPGKQILRISALRERLYVFKEDGIYTIAGEYPYRVDLVDDTSWLIAADSIALTGNQIFCLTNQGVVSVSEPGVSIVSRPIETDIFKYVQEARNGNNLKSCIGTGYNSDRIYILGLASETTEWLASSIYVYNYLNKVWTSWSKTHSWGAVHPTQDKLYFGNTRNDNSLTVERKSSERRAVDYADEAYSTTINSINETAKTMVVASATNIEIGDTLYSGSLPEPPPSANGFALALVTGINGTTISFEYIYSAADVGYVNFTGYVGSAGALKIFKHYDVEIQYATITGGDVTLLKQFQELALVFGNRSFKNVYAYFASNALPSSVQATLMSAEPLFSDGRYHKLSMDAIVPTSKRLVVPRAQQQATNLTLRLTFSEAMAYWRLLGFNYEANGISKLANRTR